MTELSIKDYIRNGLFFEAQSVALDFVSFLEEKGVDFYKDNCDCWKDKIYYQCKFNNCCVCFISAKFHLRTYQRTPSCPKPEERYHSVRGRDIFSSAPLSFPLQ